MEEFKSNSHKSREAAQTEKKNTPVVTEGVTIRKESATKKFWREMISEDLVHVLMYIKDDVLIPALKAAISGGVDMLVYGERQNNRNSRNNSSYRTSYGSYYEKDPRNKPDKVSYEKSSRSSYEDISFNSYAGADAVLDKMIDTIRHYGVVSIADLYDFVDIPSSYTDHKYGWERDMLDDAKPYRAGNRDYRIGLPRPIPLD